MKESLKKLKDNKIFWMIISLFVSTGLWFYLTSMQGTIVKTRLNNVELVLEGREAMNELRNLTISEIDHKFVSLEISCTVQNMALITEESLKAVVDVSSINSPGRYSLTYNLEYPKRINPEEITLVHSNPKIISILVENVSRKNVPVKISFSGSVAEGYIVEEAICTPEFVSVSGSETEVNKIDHVKVDVLAENLKKETTVEMKFVPMDAESNPIVLKNAKFDRETVSVTVPVSKKKDVPLNVILIDGAGANQNNTTVRTDPEFITIAGDAETVDSINKIDLITLELDSFDRIYEAKIPVAIPNDLKNVSGETEARVKVEIFNLENRVFSVSNFNYSNLPSEFKSADFVTKTLAVTLRGLSEEIKTVNKNNIRVIADLKDIRASGECYVDAVIFVDGYPNVGAVGKYKLIINIKD
jgi:YbbR domain-containing protein